LGINSDRMLYVQDSGRGFIEDYLISNSIAD